MSNNIEKWAPWNWFNKEEEAYGVPVRKMGLPSSNFYSGSPFGDFHREIDRMFEDVLGNMGAPTFAGKQTGFLKPNVDISETKDAYTINVEVPGVDEKDVKIELVDNTLTISGEKKHEAESKDKDWHRVERSYGSFRRMISLPEDTAQNDINAKFKNGVLTITAPRKALEKPEGAKLIDIKSAA